MLLWDLLGKFPGTDYESFNYDWVIGKLKELKDSVAAALASEEAAAESANRAAGSMGLALIYQNKAKDYRDEAQGFANDAQDSADSIADVVDQVNTNTSRISSLIAHAGDTDDNSELLDMRIGYNGVTYTTAGDAVRAQASGLEKNVVKNDKLLGQNMTFIGLEQGSLNISTGAEEVSSSRARASDYLKVDPSTAYEMAYDTNLTGYMWVLGYDSDRNVIIDGGVGGQAASVAHLNNENDGGTFTTSATTEYIRWYNTANIPLTTPVEIYPNNYWKKDVDLKLEVHSKDRIFLATPSYPEIVEKKNSAIDVNIKSNTSFYVLKENGTEYKRKDLTAGTSYTITPNQVLIWELDTNTVSVMGNNAIRNNVVTLLNNYNGKAYQGELLQAVNRERSLIKNINTTISKFKEVSNQITAQGMTVVNDVIWGFNGSADDHSDYAYITLKDSKTFYEVNSIRHNLGHCASADYCEKTDTIIVGNGSTDANNAPMLYLIKNASDLNDLTSQMILYDDTNMVKAIDVSSLVEGSGLVACFGETEKTIYMATLLDNKETRIYKAVLGRSNNQYTGAITITNTYTGVPLDIYQGMCFHNGSLYMALDSSARHEAKICKFRLYNESYYEITEEWLVIMYDNNGDPVYYEPEGLCVLYGIYFLTNLAKTNDNKMVITPINNIQGGYGYVRTPVQFPFKCNMTPRVIITPTSSDGNMYIESVDKESFTVDSETHQGSFTWQCEIS